MFTNDQRLYICAHVYSNLKFIYLYFFYQCFFMVGTTYTALFCFGRTYSLCSMYILILQTNILHVDMCIYCCFSLAYPIHRKGIYSFGQKGIYYFEKKVYTSTILDGKQYILFSWQTVYTFFIQTDEYFNWIVRSVAVSSLV